MAEESRQGLDLDRLETYLKALAYSARLELLLHLRQPRTMDEIHLTAGTEQPGTPGRVLTRQAIQNHLDQLVEVGLVRVGITQRKGRRGIHEYTLDLPRLFALTEELRKVTMLPPERPIDPFATQGLSAEVQPTWEDGAKLVLVHGIGEGSAFALLTKALAPPRGWVVGRAPDAAVRLEYDPFVSSENAEILREGKGYRLLDLRSARNGTHVNWRVLPRGSEVPLRDGDVIGVGRTLLVFRSA